jgi:four helix bundle protein
MFGFEKLDVWQRAIDFADHLYDATDDFPKDEMFGLRSQIRRAGVSVAGNIAEGWGRSSTKEFIRFTEISYSSVLETASHVRIAPRRRFLTDVAHNQVYSEAEELAKMISGFRKSLERRRQ